VSETAGRSPNRTHADEYEHVTIMETPTGALLTAEVHADRVRIMYRALPPALFAVLVNSGLLALLHWRAVDHRVLLAWLAATWILSAARLALAARFRRAQPATREIEFWARAALVGALLSGLSWGAASAFLFVPESLPHQALLAFVIAGMSAGSVTSMSAQLPASVGFVMLATLPLAYRFAHEGHPFALAMSAMVLLFAAMMVPVAQRFYLNLSEMLSERHERRLARQREQRRNQVLEQLAGGAPLAAVLEVIAKGVESEQPTMLCSILLADESGQRLTNATAPSLPAFYNEAIDGIAIGPGVGACGTAAFERKRVIVEDIRTHPYWRDFADLAVRAGLLACWSEPIVSAAGRLLGTFAIYHRQPHRPGETELLIAEQSAQLAAIAIERSHAGEALRLAAAVYQNSSEAIMITDGSGRIVAINPAFTEITGYAREEVMEANPRLLSSGRHDAAFYREFWRALRTSGRWQGELWNRRKSGEEFAAWLTVDTIYDKNGSVYRRMALFSDITEKKMSEALIWTQANYDPVTELPNRRLFVDRLDQGLKLSDREGTKLALLFIDLDRFKEVNDTLGHHVGDQLLVEAATRIRACVRESDTVARLGGDEFTVILAEVKEPSRIGQIAQNIIDALGKPCWLADEQLFTTASIGITVYPDDATSREELLKNADQAMFAAKQEGRNRFNYFTRAMQESTHQRLRLIRDLRKALAEDQFTVHFQPVVELATGRIQKAEALVRWQHPERGFIGPATFIPIAEETGLIHEIGDRVFREAARYAKSWRTRYHPRLQISVNRSPVQFMAGNVAGNDWMGYLRALDLPGDGIVFEITEGVLLEARANIDSKLLRLRDAGIQVAIDDFGTGYSSLAYLKRFDIDYLKIDRSFVSNLESDASDRALSEAIVVMAHKLGFQVIAEGVETPAQRDILARIGCDYAQGYLFSAPVPAAQFESLLANQCASPVCRRVVGGDP